MHKQNTDVRSETFFCYVSNVRGQKLLVVYDVAFLITGCVALMMQFFQGQNRRIISLFRNAIIFLILSHFKILGSNKDEMLLLMALIILFVIV